MESLYIITECRELTAAEPGEIELSISEVEKTIFKKDHSHPLTTKSFQIPPSMQNCRHSG